MLQFIRSVIFFIGMVIVLPLVIAPLLICAFCPIKMRYTIASRFAVFNIWWLKITVGIYCEVIGGHHIPKTPCVILSNHQSTWETFMLQLVFPAQVWVIKKQLLYIPIFGWGIALLKPIVISRSRQLSALKKIIKQGKQRLKLGLWVVIFPEGTRQKKVGHYQSGAAMIAKSAQVPILPIYHNAGDFWKKGQFMKQSGTIKFIIGLPLESAHKSAKELSFEVEKWAKAQEKILHLKV